MFRYSGFEQLEADLSAFGPSIGIGWKSIIAAKSTTTISTPTAAANAAI